MTRPAGSSTRVVGAVVVALFGLAGCSDDSTTDGDPAPTTTAPVSDDSTPDGSTPDGSTPDGSIPDGSTPDDREVVDQTSPASANGLKVAEDGSVWIASIDGDELVRVDPASGEILDRLATPVDSGPDDVVIADDGTIYWTGYLDGSVGSADPATGTVEVLGSVGDAANPIDIADDGSLLFGRAVTGTGLYSLPAEGGEPTFLGDPGNLNSFDLGPDGRIYGPIMSGAVVSIDPADVSEPIVIVTLEPLLAGVRWHDGTLYVLSLSGGDASVVTVDPETGDTAVLAATGQALADNLAVAPDGTVYVSGFQEPTITTISPDGSRVETLRIGQ